MKSRLKSILCMALSAAMTLTLAAPVAMATGRTSSGSSPQQVTLPTQDWQAEVSFPDWAGYVDDTLAMNSLYSFTCFADQGELYVTPEAGVRGFRLFVNNVEVDTSSMKAGSTSKVDISNLTVDGTNTIQVSAINPTSATVKVNIPYPTVIEGTPADVGMDEEIVETINDFINAEVKYGFSGAQLAVIKDGKLVISEAYGAANGYRTDSSRILPTDDDYVPVTTETLYDLASNTKMYSVNYALQYMLSHPEEHYDIGLDDPITKFFPEFDDEGKTIFKEGTSEEMQATIYQWKSELTVRDILMHQAGFDPDPQYHNDQFNQVTQTPEAGKENLLFSQDRDTTREKVLASPLTYKPGTQTVYSDVDYMLLCFIIEKVTGQGLDQFLKEKFWDPMGLTHVTYNPLENGFMPEDCAATELDGNHRTDAAGHGQAIDFENCRDGVVQGTVHDEKAYYAMEGISGHAGLFANAEDLAKLCSLMLTGGYEGHKYFDANIIDEFTKPKSTGAATWGLGWWRQGDVGRRSYFSTHGSENTIGHQGWTGTLTVIDPDENLVVVVLTNKKNSPIMDNTVDANDFFSDNMVLGGLGIATGLVYDAFRSSVEAVDGKIAQMAYNRAIMTYNQHQGAYDEAPHMYDALALHDLQVTCAEKRPTEQNLVLTQWMWDMNGAWIFDPQYNIIQREDDKAAIQELFYGENGLKTRIDAVLAAGATAEDAQPQMKAELIPEEERPVFFSKGGFIGGHDQNAVYLPYAYGKNYTSCVYDNSSFWFDGYEGQGTLYFQNIYGEYWNFPGPGKRMQIHVNGVPVDLSQFKSDDNAYASCWKVDISGYTVNGRNTVQVSGIDGNSNYLLMAVENPEVANRDDISLTGVDAKVLELIDKLIQSDVDYGFPSAQLAIVKDGKMIYSNAWGAANSYHSDGTRILPGDEDYVPATTDTLYDLASNTKMYAVNYALQKLVSDGKISLTASIANYINNFAVKDNIAFKTGTTDEQKDQIVQWKQQLTIQDILQHQAGFDPDPQFHNDQFNQDTQQPEAGVDNSLYAIGKDAVKEAVCKAPLNYEPGTKTVYSDVDYMLLGLIIEQVTGADLDTWLKANIYEPLGLTHITYKPLENGFEASQVAATELNGNSRDGVIDFTGIREGVIQGTVHDEKAYYAMGGVSGHAGLFANAEDLAVLAQTMLNPSGQGETKFWTRNVKDYFIDRKDSSATWGQGWWRQGDCGRPWYFGVQASRDTIGHQGWTGTLTVIDPASDLVIVYLTNKINSPVTDNTVNPNQFDGNWYTASTLGFVSNILYLGFTENNVADDIQPALDALLGDMAIDKLRLVEDEGDVAVDHPVVQSAYAVVDLAIEMTEARSNDENISALRRIASMLNEQRDAEKLAQVNELLDRLDPPVVNPPVIPDDTTTTTVTNPDGSTTTTTENKTTGTVTETTQYPDGSKTVVKTEKDGTVTTTETDKNGNKTVTVVEPDGSVEVTLPSAVVSAAQEKDETISLPISEIEVTKDAETATAVTVNTGSEEPVKVEIPVDHPTSGTVAVLVKAEGTEEIIKTSVVTETGVVVELTDGATVKLVDNSKSFVDVPTQNYWAKDAIDFVTARELFVGTSENTFSPDAPMTRAMLMTVLARLDGADTNGGTTWYEKGMAWAVANGVSDGTFPNDNITREQLVTMLWRYAGSPDATSDLSQFVDAGQISDYAQTAVRWAVENGIIQGFGNGELGPRGQATRAQVAQMLKNFIER